jgi:glycogen debranching enzyme
MNHLDGEQTTESRGKEQTVTARDVLIQEAYQRAVAVLRRCVTPHGFRASGMDPGYPQIWARDSMITSLGAALTGEPELRRRSGRPTNLRQWYWMWIKPNWP